MGNCYGARKEPEPLIFDQTEYSALNKQFLEYCDLSVETRNAKALNEKMFEDIFQENPQFGIKLFRFLQVYSGGQEFIPKEPLFEFLEALVKDTQTNNPCFKNFERFEIMSLISLQDARYLKSKEELAELQLTYLETMMILKDIIKIYQNGQKNPATNEKYLKGFVDMLYKNEAGTIAWRGLVEFVSKQLPGVKEAIKHYFQAKFMNFRLKPLIPQINSPSYFLCDELYFQLSMSTNSILKNCFKLQLIYSNMIHLGGFDQLISNLLESKVPTLLFVQHEEQYEQKIKTHQFGALTNLKWYDTKSAFGTKQDCIFQLNPYFKILRTKRKDENYCYLDSQKGFGFGGNEKGENCRIWIDKNLEDSYTTNQDNTYENGNLVEPYIKQIKVNLIEIWGIHHPQEDHEVDNTEVQMDLKDPLLNQQIPELDALDSKADYYWVTKEEQEQAKAGYYWENQQTEEVKTIVRTKKERPLI